MSMRGVILASVPVLAAIAGVWWLQRDSADGGGNLFSSGVVEATQADLGFQIPGRIASIGPREGDRIRAGDKVASLDQAELQARLAMARSQLDAARSRLAELERGALPEELAQAEARLRTAEEQRADAARDMERARILHEGGAISQEAFDKARTALEVATAGRDQAAEALALLRRGPRQEVLEAQRAVVRQARAQIEQVEAQLDHARIVAPFDGVVTVRHREPGEVVAGGLPVITVRNMEDRWVRIYVREDAIGRVSIGQAATVSADSYPDREFQGRVTFIASEAEFTPRNVQTTEERTRLVYAVKVRISDDPDYVLKPGVPADVRLHEGET